jgi:hypothetical protein
MNNLVKVFLAVLLNISTAKAIDIKCHHQKNAWTTRGPLQECLVENLVVSNKNVVVEKLNKHDYHTIKYFYIHKSPLCLFMPSGIEKFLDQLEVLVVAGSGLKEIRQSDLKPFQFLKDLYMNHNELEFLKSDLFEFNTQIVIINFEAN